MANYNTLSLAFFVIGLSCMLKENLTKKDFILQGMIAFLITFTKQNMGIYYLLAVMVVIFFEKMTVKKKMMNLFTVLILFFLLGIGSIVYFQYAGILNGFIDYAILGIREFGEKNILINKPLFVFWILVVGLNIFMIKHMKKKTLINSKEYEKIKRVLIFSIF